MVRLVTLGTNSGIGKSGVVVIWRGFLPHLMNMAVPQKVATDNNVNEVMQMNFDFSGLWIFIACLLAASIGEILVTPILLYSFMTRVFARPIMYLAKRRIVQP